MPRLCLVVISFLFLHTWCSGQTVDTIPPSPKGTQLHTPVKLSDTSRLDSAGEKRHKKDQPYKVDSLTKRVRNPRRATLYSTFFPGLGQFYNHKYWKIPLAWAAVGIPAYTYFYNRSWYNKCQTAISIIDTYQALGESVPASEYSKVDPKLRSFLDDGSDNALRSYRNEYRKDEDYSVLFFILFWGLNIVDATVDAHLASFDVGDQLTMRLGQPSPNAMIGTPTSPGLGASLVIDFHKPRSKRLSAMP